MTKQLPIHLPQTEIHTEIMQQSLKKQFGEAREEKTDLEKTYCYAVHEIHKRTYRKISKLIDGQKQILSGESGITYL